MRIRVIILLTAFVLMLYAMLAYAGVEPGRIKFYIAPILALALMGFIMFDFSGFICFLFFLMPFSLGLFKFEISVVTFDLFSLGIVVSAGLVVVKVLTGNLRWRPDFFMVVLSGICLFYLVTTLQSENLMGSGRLAFASVFIPVISFLCVRTLVENETDSGTILKYVISGTTLFAACGILNALLHGMRMKVLGQEPISIATFIMVPVIYLLFNRLWDSKRLNTFLVAITLVGLFLTFSRVYLVVLLILPVAFWIIRKGHAMMLFMGTMAITLALTLAAVSFMPRMSIDLSKAEAEQIRTSSRRLANISHLKLVVAARLQQYQKGLDRFMEHPLIGVGIRRGEVHITQHNFHIEWLESGGILGYMLFTMLFWAYVRRLARPARQDRNAACSLLVVFAILVNALTNGLMHGAMPLVTLTMMGVGLGEQQALAGEGEA